MVQDGKSQEIDETDGLPFPQRIWAVVAIGFALCMSVLDINISTVILPTLAHDFGTSDSVITWIVNGYQLAIVVSLLSFSALGEIFGYRKVFLSGIALFCVTSLIRFLLDSDNRPYFPGIQCISYHQCKYSPASSYLSEKTDRTWNGD